MNDFDRLYVLIIQYGLSKDCEYEEKIKHLQGLICRQKVNLQDLLQYIMLRPIRKQTQETTNRPPNNAMQVLQPISRLFTRINRYTPQTKITAYGGS